MQIMDSPGPAGIRNYINHRNLELNMYIIEHMEPRLWRWCIIEYKHISKLVGRKNVWFTNVKEPGKLRAYGKVSKKSVKELAPMDACVLDPDVKETLTPKEAKTFKHFIFGGILGDYPPRKRTKKDLTPFVAGVPRNLGKRQMSTDNAVLAVKLIKSGIPFGNIKFRQGIEIKMGKHLSVKLPYRYVMQHGKPNISEELVAFIKKRKGF